MHPNWGIKSLAIGFVPKAPQSKTTFLPAGHVHPNVGLHEVSSNWTKQPAVFFLQHHF
jgi:hypothetical protein